MTTSIDQRGNLHRGKGAGGGQFADKHNSRPGGGMRPAASPLISGLDDARVQALSNAMAPREGQMPEQARDRFAIHALAGIFEPGDRVAGLAVRKFGAVTVLNKLIDDPDDLDAMIAMTGEVTMQESADAVARWRPRTSANNATKSAETAARHGIKLVTPGDGLIPSRFDDLEDAAPIGLYVQGDPERLAWLDDSVAIVGARAATGYGEYVAGELAATAAERGKAIVSGGAYGVDAAAHRGALVADGRTISFLAGGLDRYYPAGNQELLSRVAKSGLVISELPPGTPPATHRFLKRNRLIAAAAPITVVVEAGLKSGSLNAASHARGLGRIVAAVPGPITSPASSGANTLLDQGARVVRSADDIDRLLAERDSA